MATEQAVEVATCARQSADAQIEREGAEVAKE